MSAWVIFLRPWRTVTMAAWFMRFMSSAPVEPAVARATFWKSMSSSSSLSLACTSRMPMRPWRHPWYRFLVQRKVYTIKRCNRTQKHCPRCMTQIECIMLWYTRFKQASSCLMCFTVLRPDSEVFGGRQQSVPWGILLQRGGG